MAALKSCAVDWPYAIVCVGFGWFVGLSQSDINWSTIWSTNMLQCNEPSTWQLSNFGSLTEANHQQQTTHKPNRCSLLQGCWFEPQLQPNIFLFQHLIWEVAYGAKVGLNLTLGNNLKKSDHSL